VNNKGLILVNSSGLSASSVADLPAVGLAGLPAVLFIRRFCGGLFSVKVAAVKRNGHQSLSMMPVASP